MQSVRADEVESHLERARLAERAGLGDYYRGAFSRADRSLSEACELYWREGEIKLYIECAVYLLRVLAEQEKTAQVEALETRVIDLLFTSGDSISLPLKSRAYYVLGVCSSILSASNKERAANFFKLSISAAMDANDSRALAFPVYGLAYLNFGSPEVERYIGQLETILSVVTIPELSASVLILTGLIARSNKDFTRALELFWMAYRQLREYPNFTLYIQAIHSIGSVHLQIGDLKAAQHYLDLAENALLPNELPRLTRLVDSSRAKLREAKPKSSYDYQVDCERGLIFDQMGVKYDLKEQFVLRELAMMFFTSQGKVFNKDEISRRVWDENYDPLVHDNKIYVTVRRLRRLLETNDHPSRSTIVRAKDGYTLNPDLKINLI